MGTVQSSARSDQSLAGMFRFDCFSGCKVKFEVVVIVTLTQEFYRASFGASDDLVMKLELEAKNEVSKVGEAIGSDAWGNWCRWAKMIRQNVAAMLLPYSCIHKDGFGGAKAIAKMLEPFNAEICIAIEEENVGAKLDELVGSIQKKADDLKLRIAALSAKGVSGMADAKFENREESGAPPDEEKDEDQAAVVGFEGPNKRNVPRTHVLDWKEEEGESFDRLKQVGAFGNDEMIDLGLALFLDQCFSLAVVVSSLKCQLWRQKKSVPKFAPNLLQSKVVVMPWHFKDQKHFVGVCIVDPNSNCPQIFVYDDVMGYVRHEVIARELTEMIEQTQGRKLADWDLKKCLHSVRVSQQKGGSNECWLSTLLNLGIVAAFGEMEGPRFLYKDEKRKRLRACLVAIAEWQQNEKNDSLYAVPKELIDQFKSCILGVAAMETQEHVGQCSEQAVHVAQQNVSDVLQEKVQKRAKIGVHAVEQDQSPMANGSESEWKRSKLDPILEGLSEEICEDELEFWARNSSPEEQELN